MRCTRCDRIVMPQAVGLGPDGVVVFGWCLACLIEEECVLVEVPGDWLIKAPVLPGVRAARRRPPSPSRDIRRRTICVIAGLMAAWAAALIVVGILRLREFPTSPSPFGNGSAPLLLLGGGLMALVSLAVYGSLLDRARLFRIGLIGVQVAGPIIGFGILLGAAIHHDPRRDLEAVPVAALAFAVAWLARWYEQRSRRTRVASKSGTSPHSRGVLLNLDDNEFEIS